MPNNPIPTYIVKPGGVSQLYNVSAQNVGPIYRNSLGVAGINGGVPLCLYRIFPIAIGTSGTLTFYDSATAGAPIAVVPLTNGSATITTTIPHNFTAGNQVVLTGTVPLPYLVNTTYYVSATGLAALTFQLSTTLTGTPAVVTGTTGNVGILPAIAATFTNASASIAATAHGLSIGQAVTLTGTVPLPYITNTTYYVIATGFTANAFQLGFLPAGASVGAVSGSTTTVNVALGCHLGSQIFSAAYNALTVGVPLVLECAINNGLVMSSCPVAAQYTFTLG
jgi:hypothetical protein